MSKYVNKLILPFEILMIKTGWMQVMQLLVGCTGHHPNVHRPKKFSTFFFKK